MYKAKIFCGDNFWMVAYVEADLCKYLRTLYCGYKSNVDKIQKPIWSSHISILRKEEPLEERVNPPSAIDVFLYQLQNIEDVLKLHYKLFTPEFSFVAYPEDDLVKLDDIC